MLLSRLELKCCSQSRSWKYPICFSEDLLDKKERSMMKEWFPKTPMVHKLDEVSSWYLADCSKYVRESQWRRVYMLCHVGWLVLLLASGEVRRGRQDRSVCSKGLRGRASERMLPRLFIVARGSDPGRMAWNILIGRKYEFGTKQSKYSCARQ